MKAVKEAVDQSNAETKDLLYSTTKLSNQLLKMMQTLKGQSQKIDAPASIFTTHASMAKGSPHRSHKRAGTVGQENCHYSAL